MVETRLTDQQRQLLMNAVTVRVMVLEGEKTEKGRAYLEVLRLLEGCDTIVVVHRPAR